MTSKYQCNLCHNTTSTIITSQMKDWEYGVEGTYDYRRCKNCFSIQLHPFPTTADLIKAYDIDYHGYSSSESKGIIFRVMYKIKEMMYLNSLCKITGITHGKILDVGCGVGEFLELFKANTSFELLGIDFNPKAIDECRKRGIEGFCGTFEEFEAHPSSFSLISMNNYLEHTLNPVAEINKAYSLLKDQGCIIGEVPGFNSFDRKLFNRYWGGNHVPRHTYQFDFDYLSKILKNAGFREVKIKHELNTGHWALSVQNYFQRNVKNLKSNPNLNSGRTKYYKYLLILFIPVNLVSILFNRSGVVKFYAKK